MTSDIEILNKDSIKMNILREIVSGNIKVSLALDGNAQEDYATKIHNERSRVQVYGKFNVSEDATGDILTIRPVVVESRLVVSFNIKGSISNKLISIHRNATKTIEKEFELSSNISYLEFIPQGRQKYLLRISYGSGDVSAPMSPTVTDRPVYGLENNVDMRTVHQTEPEAEHMNSGAQVSSEDRIEEFTLDSGSEYGVNDNRFASFNSENETVVSSTTSSHIEEHNPSVETIIPAGRLDNLRIEESDAEMRRLEREISVIERKQGELSQKKNSAINHLKKIEAEYKKDYASFELELADIKSRIEADAMVIEHYKEYDIIPIETILQEIKLKFEEAEKQIRFFIEARQRKTMEIEGEIKSNKNQ
jgi:hypothetical protein